MHRHLGIVGACLHHDVTARATRLQGIAGKVRQVDQGIGPLSVQAKAGLAVLLEQGGAEAECDGEPAGVDVQGLAGVLRRGVVWAVDGAGGSGGPAGGHGLRGGSPVLEEFDDRRTVFDGDVEGRHVEAVLRSGGDPGLAVAEEGDDGIVGGRGCCGGRQGVVAEQAGGDSGHRSRAAHASQTQKSAAGQAGVIAVGRCRSET